MVYRETKETALSADTIFCEDQKEIVQVFDSWDAPYIALYTLVWPWGLQELARQVHPIGW